MVLYPNGYGTTMISLDEMKMRHGERMHPEYRRRLFPWIESKGGVIGIGGGFRITQPVRPGFAPPGKSFHEKQRFASGIEAYCAVDLVHVRPGHVHRSPTWGEVLPQGTHSAQAWKLHCNVNGEPWHMQPIEIDGYDSWVHGGRKDPVPPPPPPTTSVPPYTIPEGEEMISGLWKCPNDPGVYQVCTNRTKVWCYPGTVDEAQALLRLEGKPDAVNVQTSSEMFRAMGPVVGPRPAGVDEYGWRD